MLVRQERDLVWVRTPGSHLPGTKARELHLRLCRGQIWLLQRRARWKRQVQQTGRNWADNHITF